MKDRKNKIDKQIEWDRLNEYLIAKSDDEILEVYKTEGRLCFFAPRLKIQRIEIERIERDIYLIALENLDANKLIIYEFDTSKTECRKMSEKQLEVVPASRLERVERNEEVGLWKRRIRRLIFAAIIAGGIFIISKMECKRGIFTISKMECKQGKENGSSMAIAKDNASGGPSIFSLSLLQ